MFAEVSDPPSETESKCSAVHWNQRALRSETEWAVWNFSGDPDHIG